MARIKAIFGPSQHSGQIRTICVWENDSQSKGNYRGEKKKRLRSSLDVLMDSMHQRLNLIPGLGVNTSMLSYDS